jgi:hypothetical protein
MSKNKSFISKKEYIKNIESMKMRLQNNRENPLHQFHYGRLLADGLDEDSVVKMLYNTASVLELAYDEGAIRNPEQIEKVYNALPSNDPTRILDEALNDKKLA